MNHMSNSVSNLSEAQNHAWYQHRDSDGWITVGKKTADGFKQVHYQPNELVARLSEWLGEDVYFSQNTFYKPQRKIENVRQLRALYVDVDYYLMNFDKDWILGNIDLLVIDNVIPRPNHIIHSGRGIVCIWLLDPVPYQALPLWQAVEHHFVEKFKRYGGDAKATDAARIFRVAGSVNSKSGETVTISHFHDHRYVLRELQEEYLPALTPKKKAKGRPSRLIQLHNVYRLHYARLRDLSVLVELRNYDVVNYRELICFLYRYWSCCVLSDPEEALNQTLELNKTFKHPLSDREVLRATKSAEKAWVAKSDKKANEEAIAAGYPGAGYNLSNSKIIDWLDITDEEMEHLSTIINAPEKRRRKLIRDKYYQEQKRRDRGDLKREEYLKEQSNKTDNLLFRLEELLSENPSRKKNELAKLLGISTRHLYRLIKELKV